MKKRKGKSKTWAKKQINTENWTNSPTQKKRGSKTRRRPENSQEPYHRPHRSPRGRRTKKKEDRQNLGKESENETCCPWRSSRWEGPGQAAQKKQEKLKKAGRDGRCFFQGLVPIHPNKGF